MSFMARIYTRSGYHSHPARSAGRFLVRRAGGPVTNAFPHLVTTRLGWRLRAVRLSAMSTSGSEHPAKVSYRLLSTLDISRGNKKEAARLLQLNRTTLLENLKRKRETARVSLGVVEDAERLGPVPMRPDASQLVELPALAGGQALRA